MTVDIAERRKRGRKKERDGGGKGEEKGRRDHILHTSYHLEVRHMFLRACTAKLLHFNYFTRNIFGGDI